MGFIADQPLPPPDRVVGPVEPTPPVAYVPTFKLKAAVIEAAVSIVDGPGLAPATIVELEQAAKELLRRSRELNPSQDPIRRI